MIACDRNTILFDCAASLVLRAAQFFSLIQEKIRLQYSILFNGLVVNKYNTNALQAPRTNKNHITFSQLVAITQLLIVVVALSMMKQTHTQTSFFRPRPRQTVEVNIQPKRAQPLTKNYSREASVCHRRKKNIDCAEVRLWMAPMIYKTV